MLSLHLYLFLFKEQHVDALIDTMIQLILFSKAIVLIGVILVMMTIVATRTMPQFMKYQLQLLASHARAFNI